MSTPSDQQPDHSRTGGYYPAPPPPRRNSPGCLKIGGITCGVLMLIAVLAGVIMFQLFKPMFRSLSHSVNDAVKVQQQGLSLWNAIGRYKSYTGSYPNKLEDLVPKYLENFNSMHSAVDTNRDPNHVSWEYFKPSQNADPSAPILREDYKMQNPATTDPNLAIQQSITITVGGKIVPHTSTVPQPTWHG